MFCISIEYNILHFITATYSLLIYFFFYRLRKRLKNLSEKHRASVRKLEFLMSVQNSRCREYFFFAMFIYNNIIRGFTLRYTIRPYFPLFNFFILFNRFEIPGIETRDVHLFPCKNCLFPIYYVRSFRLGRSFGENIPNYYV